MIESLAAYASYLSIRNKAMKIYHASPEPPVSFSDSSCLKHINNISTVLPLLTELDIAVSSAPCYHKICVSDYSPQAVDTSSFKSFKKDTHHSNVGNYHFVWKAPSPLHEGASTCENLRLIEEIKKEIPVYHTRAMKREFFDLYGRLSPESKPYLLRSMYHTLTNDCSTSRRKRLIPE